MDGCDVRPLLNIVRVGKCRITIDLINLLRESVNQIRLNRLE